MKKIRPFYLVIFLLLLTGCQSHEEKLESGINEIQENLQMIISESEISDFIEGDIKFDQYDTIISEDKTVFMYNIVIPVKLSYLKLEPSKQYRLLKEPTQQIFEYQGNDNGINQPKGMPIFETNDPYDPLVINYDERIKHSSLILTFGNSNDTYTISLNDEYEKILNSSSGELKNVIFGNISNEAYVILSNGELLHEGQYVEDGNYAFKETSSDESTQTTTEYEQNSLAPNNEWNRLSSSEKYDWVVSYLVILQRQGYTIHVNVDYFIEALDVYYDGSIPNDTMTIEEAIKTVGFGGGVISK